jgi:hypothetical protein
LLNEIIVQDIDLYSVIHSRTGGFTAGLSAFVITLLTLMLPATVQADDFFDTQLQLAKQGNPEAQFKVGEMYETGTGVNQNKREAIYWTKRSANQKYETARFKLLYWDLEKKGLNADNKTRLEWLNNRAKQGNAQAQYYLGKIYAHGAGINKNPEVAITWLNKAASAGVLEAELELATVSEDKQRQAVEERRFESDPCSGKTARFLSTCK